MKKRGFTLAEVMIALGLIGVIASLTIPTFIADSKNRSNAAKLATTISAVENAFTTMLAAESANDLTETRFGAARTEANLGRYLKLQGSQNQVDPDEENEIQGINALSSYYNTNSPFVTLNRAGSQPAVSTIFQTKNSALLIYHDAPVAAPDDESHPGSIGQLTIDVNGSAQPNVWGRDVFYFRIGNDGVLYPAGGAKFTAIDPAEGANMSCSGDIRNQGCTARLIENNFVMNY